MTAILIQGARPVPPAVSRARKRMRRWAGKPLYQPKRIPMREVLARLKRRSREPGRSSDAT